jgi:hypothetical protein
MAKLNDKKNRKMPILQRKSLVGLTPGSNLAKGEILKEILPIYFKRK